MVCHIDAYRCWCEFCSFSKEAENLEGVVNITDQHRIDCGHNRFIELNLCQNKRNQSKRSGNL